MSTTEMKLNELEEEIKTLNARLRERNFKVRFRADIAGVVGDIEFHCESPERMVVWSNYLQSDDSINLISMNNSPEVSSETSGLSERQVENFQSIEKFIRGDSFAHYTQNGMTYESSAASVEFENTDDHPDIESFPGVIHQSIANVWIERGRIVAQRDGRNYPDWSIPVSLVPVPPNSPLSSGKKLIGAVKWTYSERTNRNGKPYRDVISVLVKA